MWPRLKLGYNSKLKHKLQKSKFWIILVNFGQAW